MSGSPLKRRCQNAWLRTATGRSPGAASSSGRKNRPSAGRVPSTSKNEPDTSTPVMRSLPPFSTRLIGLPPNSTADIEASVVV